MKLTDLPAGAIVRQSKNVPSVTVFVPIRTVTVANVREHFMARKRRVSNERLAMRRALEGRRVPVLPVVVTFLRQSAGVCDDDGLPTAAKALRDEIALLYGVGDAPSDPIAWRYAQERCKRGAFGMRVTIEHGVEIGVRHYCSDGLSGGLTRSLLTGPAIESAAAPCGERGE